MKYVANQVRIYPTKEAILNFRSASTTQNGVEDDPRNILQYNCPFRVCHVLSEFIFLISANQILLLALASIFLQCGFRFEISANQNSLLALVAILNGQSTQKNKKAVEDYSMNILQNYHSNWSSGFRDEDWNVKNLRSNRLWQRQTPNNGFWPDELKKIVFIIIPHCILC